MHICLLAVQPDNEIFMGPVYSFSENKQNLVIIIASLLYAVLIVRKYIRNLNFFSVF